MELTFSNAAFDTPCGRRIFSIEKAVIHHGITALTGHNGAGKSTLLRTIFGLHPLAEGSITLDGIDSRKERKAFLANAVFQPQNFTAYPELTGLEFLIYFLRLRGYSRKVALSHSNYWIEQVGLSEAASRQTAEYSQGMLQRLGFAYAMQSGARLCVLDEPFAGVDPIARSQLSDLLTEAAEQKIILICTHHVEEMTMRDAAVVSINNGIWEAGIAK